MRYIAVKMVIAIVLHSIASTGMFLEGMLFNGDNWKIALMGLMSSSFDFYEIEIREISGK